MRRELQGSEAAERGGGDGKMRLSVISFPRLLSLRLVPPLKSSASGLPTMHLGRQTGGWWRRGKRGESEGMWRKPVGDEVAPGGQEGLSFTTLRCYGVGRLPDEPVTRTRTADAALTHTTHTLTHAHVHVT